MHARRRMPSLRPARAGFTLVELLTVIAVVGILAAILIPVVGSVRESARKTECASNLRQMGVSLRLYAADNRGFLPAPSAPGPDPDNPTAGASRWNRDLEEYLPRRRSTNNAIFEHEIFVCPSAQGSGGQTGKELKMCYNATQALYGLNGSTLSRFVRRSVNTITNPSQTTLIYEGALLSSLVVQSNYYHAWSQILPEVGKPLEQLNRPDGILAFRHKGSMNIAMVDGSVRSVSPDWLRTLTQKRWEGLE